MKTTSNHLSQIILAVAAIALIVGIVLTFTTPIGGFFSGVTDKLQSIGTGDIWDLGDYGGGSGGSGGPGNPGGNLEALSVPTISLNGNTLNIFDTSGAAESFDILVNGSVVKTISATNTGLLSNNSSNNTPTLLSSGSNEATTYSTSKTLSGEWEFYSEPAFIEIEQSINFTSNGANFDKMTFGDSNAAYYWNGSESVRVCYTWQWSNYNFRTVDFGSTPQEVTDEFYEWFTANAIQYVEIDGAWRFNQTLDFSFEPLILVGLDFSITLDGNVVDRNMLGAADGEEQVLVYYSGYQDACTAYTDGVWTFDELRTIYIAGVQEVSTDVYIWLTANATKLPTEPTATFDLSTLNLENGTHSITVIAKAEGYADSVESNAVSYVVN